MSLHVTRELFGLRRGRALPEKYLVGVHIVFRVSAPVPEYNLFETLVYFAAS